MKIKTILFYTIFILANSFQSQATIVQIEEENTKLHSCLNFFTKISNNNSDNIYSAQKYTEYFSNDILLVSNLKHNKPRSVFINTSLLSTLNESYQNKLMNTIGHQDSYYVSSYYKESFNIIKENIDLFTKQLKSVSMKRTISLKEYDALIFTQKVIDQKISRAKTEFSLRNAEGKYFVKVS
ncbi:MAG: hypothetical protein ACRYGR_10285 [Janthinobacterium lividum]